MTTKNALITGGSRGLGMEVARLLSESGHRVTIVGRSAELLDSAVRSFPGEGHRGWVFDLSQPAQTQQLVRRLEGESFDLLINNAGASRIGPFSELSAQTVEALIYLNFTTPALLIRQFLHGAPAGSVIVNVTSIVATVPIPGDSLYCAAKAGLSTLSECLWFEARERRVRVLDFRPVTLRTTFHRSAGGESLSTARVAVDPAVAARDLVRAIESGRDFVYPHTMFGRMLELAGRFLPRKFLISQLGRRSSRAGYFAPSA